MRADRNDSTYSDSTISSVVATAMTHLYATVTSRCNSHWNALHILTHNFKEQEIHLGFLAHARHYAV